MKSTKLITLLIAFLSLNACKNSTSEKAASSPPSPTETQHPVNGQASVTDNVSDPNALQVAKSLDDFKTLVVAIEAADLENTLVNAGPLTVFAPVNAAFNKLPEGKVSSLLEPENTSKLAVILKNHVAPANYPLQQLAKEAKKGRKLYMASGNYLDVVQKEDDIYVGGTKIIKTVQVSNGWIHVINDVLIPTEEE
ncbi:fasciclin domain-containing protein [Flavobacteriaceae bacterium F08102]|nr:fasciclin domain-containing protein [Flavobacteriaceae bacterium F08102]